MGSHTVFQSELIILDKIFDYKIEVTGYIEEIELKLQNVKNRLLILSSGDIDKLVPDEERDFKVSWFQEEFNSILEDIERYNYLLCKLYSLDDYLLENNLNKIPEELKDI